MIAVATDLLALTLLESPGSQGADIAVGSSQRFGVPMAFGGPHAGFIATRESLVRALPGRLVGVSKDSGGRVAFRLALQTREQHIRRERATSNVCTAQVLLAIISALYACWHGPEGLAAIARRVNHLAGRLAAEFAAAGIEIENQTWFDTLTVRVPACRRGRGTGSAVRHQSAAGRRGSGWDLLRRAQHAGNRRRPDRVFGLPASRVRTGRPKSGGLPPELVRPIDFLTHDVFHRYRSEHEMLRYLRRLADRDLALDRTMIPLGSCTMKLNATAEMIPITWEGFARIHPVCSARSSEWVHGADRAVAGISRRDHRL